MDCPICHDPFDTEKSLSAHLEDHKKKSFLNSSTSLTTPFQEKLPISNIQTDIGEFFWKERFENLIIDKLKNIEDEEDLVNRRNFVEQIKKIISKHPFVYLPYFIEDLFQGLDSKKLLEKYSIPYHADLKNITQTILKLDKSRYRQKKLSNAFEMNLQISTWKEKYEILKDNCNFFKNELLELIFFNTLRSYIIIIITDYVETGISQKEIMLKSMTLKNNYDIFPFLDKSLGKSFESFFNTNFEEITSEILDELIEDKILRRDMTDSELIVGRLSIDKIKQSIIKELEHSDSSQMESSIRTIVTIKYPSLRLIPGLNLWETSLHELDHEKIIHLESKSNFRNSNMVFLNDNYQKILQSINSIDSSHLEFHGRKISPENFIYELTELEKGDFGDHDDQVTRIAGLILAESVKLQSTPEIISEFDFSIDITNYNFRDEQLDAMKKLNFKIISNVFHCKVMIDEIFNLNTFNNLKKSLPQNEQGVVITFKEIPLDVQQILEQDSSIQIINEEGLKIWASISAIIPSRKNSIAKLYFDPITKLEKKIVKINSLDYEDGLASVSVLPEMSETTVLIRSLEEISLNETHPKDFEFFTENYLEFLEMLIKFSMPSDLIEGLFETKILDSDIHNNSNFNLNFNYSDVTVDLNAYEENHILNCTCMKWAENPLYLCPHLIYSLDYLARNRSFLDESWNKDLNLFKRFLTLIVRKNISIILDRLGVEYDQSGLDDEMNIGSFIFGMSKIKENN